MWLGHPSFISGLQSPSTTWSPKLPGETSPSTWARAPGSHFLTKENKCSTASIGKLIQCLLYSSLLHRNFPPKGSLPATAEGYLRCTEKPRVTSHKRAGPTSSGPRRQDSEKAPHLHHPREGQMTFLTFNTWCRKKSTPNSKILQEREKRNLN